MTPEQMREAAIAACKKVADEAKSYGIPQMAMGANTCYDAIRAIPIAPSPDVAGPFHFDRYVNGVKMAEDVCIERADNLQKAMAIAAKIASKGPNGEVPVLIYRATIARVKGGEG